MPDNIIFMVGEGMRLTHICPKCKKEHEEDSTPEPDKLCPECENMKSIVVSINPPPSDKKCECCHKHISKLKPFKDGSLLVKDFRPLFVADKGQQKELDHLNKQWMVMKKKGNTLEQIEKNLITYYGAEKYDKLMFLEQACNSIGAVWECSKCFQLSDLKYLKKLCVKK
jgi:rubrerythrin